MKTLQRLAFSSLLVGLAVLSMALAGSAYGGATSSRSSASLITPRAVVAEAPSRVYLCRVAEDGVTGCSAVEAR